MEVSYVWGMEKLEWNNLKEKGYPEAKTDYLVTDGEGGYVVAYLNKDKNDKEFIFDGALYWRSSDVVAWAHIPEYKI